MTNTQAVSGFQFDLLSNEILSYNDISGGMATESGFMISSNNTSVIGFSLTGNYISSQEGGILLSVNGSYDIANIGEETNIWAEEEGSRFFRILIYIYICNFFRILIYIYRRPLMSK